MSAPPDSERQAVGGFHPLYRIAQSYLGGLWLALDKRGGEPGKPVLLRRVQLPSHTPIESLQRVACAARDAMALSHENILSVVGVSHEERSLAVAYAYVEAEPLGSLSSWATRAGRQFPVGVSLRIIIDLARGVKALHGALLGWPSAPPFGGLSPDSVLVARDGRTRVSDPLVSSCATLLEGVGLSASKLAYSAPEQVHATTPLGAPSDVFACTVMLWELLTGQRWLSGSRDDIERRLLEHDLPRLSEHLPSGVAISKELAQLMARSLAWDADRRPATPATLANELEQCGHEVASVAAVAEFVAEISGPHFERRAAAVRSKFPPALRGLLAPPAPLPRMSGLIEAIRSAPEPATPAPKIQVIAPATVEVSAAVPAPVPGARRIVPLPAKTSGTSRAVTRTPHASHSSAEIAAPRETPARPVPVAAPEPKAVTAAESKAVAAEPKAVAAEPKAVAAAEPKGVAAQPKAVAAAEPKAVAAAEPKGVAAQPKVVAAAEPKKPPEPKGLAASAPKPAAASELKPVVPSEPKAIAASVPKPAAAPEPAVPKAQSAKLGSAARAAEPTQPRKPEAAPRATRPREPAAAPVPRTIQQPPEPVPEPVAARPLAPEPPPPAAPPPEPSPVAAPDPVAEPEPAPVAVPVVAAFFLEPEPALVLPPVQRTERAPAPLTERSLEHAHAPPKPLEGHSTSAPPRAPIPRAGRAAMSTLVGVAAPAVPAQFRPRPVAPPPPEDVPETQRVDSLIEFLAEPVSVKPETSAMDPDGGPTLVSHQNLPSEPAPVDLELDAFIGAEEPTEVSPRESLPDRVPHRYFEQDIETRDVELADIEPPEPRDPPRELLPRLVQLPPEPQPRTVEPRDVPSAPGSVPSRRSSGWSHAPLRNSRLGPRAVIAGVVATIAVAASVAAAMFLRAAPGAPSSPPAAIPVAAAAARAASPVLPEPSLPAPAAEPRVSPPDAGMAPDAGAVANGAVSGAGATAPLVPALGLDVAAPELRDEQLVQLFALESRTKLPSCAERLGASARRHKGKDIKKSQEQLKAARRALVQGDYPKTQLFLCSAIAHSPANTAASQAMAELALNAGDAARAKETIDKALKKKPKDPVLLGLLGDAWAMLGDLPRSRTLWAQSAQVPGSGGERSRRLVALFGAIGDRKLAGSSHGSALSYYRRAAVLSAGAHGPSAGMAEALRRLAQTNAAAPWAERIKRIPAK